MSCAASSHPASPASSVAAELAPIVAVVFVGFLIVGIAMPVLPLHVHQVLGLGPFAVGLVAGSQFVASLLSRVWAGHHADSRGAKRAVIVGLLGAAASGAFYGLSLAFVNAPEASVAILLAGRALLGAAESFIITGAIGWGLALVESSHTGKVIAWVGSAMFAAFAVGAPIGTWLYGWQGFGAVALATAMLPLATAMLIAPLKGTPGTGSARPSLLGVFRLIWLPGAGLAASSVGFGAITAFVGLLYTANGWGSGWEAFSAFAIALIVARAVAGHWPDRHGGARIAMLCVIVEAAGQALIWQAPTATVALLGAALTGLGYSLVYPGLGIEAVRRAPARGRGLAMGAYTACLDLTLGVATPGLGLVASRAGMRSVFLVGVIAALASAAFAAWIMSTTAGSASAQDD